MPEHVSFLTFIVTNAISLGVFVWAQAWRARGIKEAMDAAVKVSGEALTIVQTMQQQVGRHSGEIKGLPDLRADMSDLQTAVAIHGTQIGELYRDQTELRSLVPDMNKVLEGASERHMQRLTREWERQRRGSLAK